VLGTLFFKTFSFLRQRERDLFKKAFRERERERLKTYTFIIYIKREKERERNFGQIAPLRLRVAHRFGPR